MADLISLVGQTFGRLTVLERAEDHVSGDRRRGVRRRVQWSCECSCGNVVPVSGENLRAGLTQSCGCLSREVARETMRATFTTHGEALKTAEHSVWTGIKARCSNPRSSHYYLYGGRGVKVCDRWLDSYEAFLEDMGRRPSSEHQIERRDNSGDYEPGNCYWATREEQARNRCTNHWLTLNGVAKIIEDWARDLGMSEAAVRNRLRRGWSVEEALTIPKGGRR